MALELTKDSIDLGLVTANPDAMLAFYKDTVGLELEGVVDMPRGGKMTRLKCGTTIIKLVELGAPPTAQNPPGGLPAATGIRYFTISVADLEGAAQRCVDAGYTLAVPVMESRPGVRICMVEDPDGNWVEFLKLD